MLVCRMSVRCFTCSFNLGCQSDESRMACFSSERTSGVNFIMQALPRFLSAPAVSRTRPVNTLVAPVGAAPSSDSTAPQGCSEVSEPRALSPSGWEEGVVGDWQVRAATGSTASSSVDAHSFQSLGPKAGDAAGARPTCLPPRVLGPAEPSADGAPEALAAGEPLRMEMPDTSWPWPPAHDGEVAEAPAAALPERPMETPDVVRGTPPGAESVTSPSERLAACLPASSIVPTSSSIMNSRSLSIFPMSRQVTSTPMRNFSSAEMPYSERHTHSLSGCNRPTIISAMRQERSPRYCL
mmetsp:Transcript_68042/g.197061  ORF Transcript_68042/g.197061 Transcript_68042/m.197061 type:complete len:296 (+) Transcript_68042:603-1490(+)